VSGKAFQQKKEPGQRQRGGKLPGTHVLLMCVRLGNAVGGSGAQSKESGLQPCENTELLKCFKQGRQLPGLWGHVVQIRLEAMNSPSQLLLP
jgi:hypothetical protein